MKLPHYENSIIPINKLTGYILSETHTVGKLKAKFFRTAGFSETNVSLLEKSLLKIATTQEVKDIIATIHGRKYIIDGKIHTPNRKVLTVRTVWIIEPGQKIPRFVTTYPV